MLGFDIIDFLLIALIFTPLERLAPARRGQKILRRLLLVDLCHLVFSGMLITGGITAMMILTRSAFSGALAGEVSQIVQAQPVWLQFLEILFLADLIFYAVHRAFHAIPALWQIHAIHHSIEEMDWIAAHRVHPIDQILTKGLSITPIILLGFSPAAIAMFAFVYKWQALLIHSNIKAPFGPFRFVLASPEFHHWHHANDKVARDRNFAGQLPFIDLIFKTAYMPKGKTPQRYGVDDPVPGDYPGQLAYPFRRIFGTQNVAAGNRERAPAAE